MNDNAVSQKVFSASTSAMVQRLIGRTMIVEFGTVKKVVAKGVVQVLLSVAQSKNAVQLLNCTLLSPCSKNFSVNIEPQEDDKVLVLFPRHYDVDMFDVDNSEAIISEVGNGYNSVCGLAILMNQFRETSHKNNIIIDSNDKITITKSDADENVILNLSVGTEGITLTDANENTVSTTADGVTVTDCNNNDVSMTSAGVKVTDCNNNDMSMTSDGITITDTNGCTIETSNTSIKINNKLEIKI